uniref:PLA2c domain-containing protein n=1 Tax=Sinocyclocheilus anshuiensis TaxID=1608454 RepID=A0A671L479_9TELE
KRRKTVLKSLKKLKIHCSKDAVPNIALLGSGGGQRAMVGLLGSLVQLDKAGLLDCILYLSGVSGSTWCMASLYQEPNWSTKLETVKDQIIKRLSGPKVSWGDVFINEHRVTGHRNKHKNDPFPIYTVIDKQCKQNREGDPWFEISPHEAGYSLTGAFVKTSSFGSQFDNGCKIKDQPEMDMLYLQALCGSALADGDENKNYIWPFSILFVQFVFSSTDPNSPPADKCSQVLMDLVDMNLSVLNGIDPFDLHKSIRTNLNGELFLKQKSAYFSSGKLNLADKEAAKLHMRKYTLDICIYSDECVCIIDVCFSICKCAVWWIWGTKYDFLHNMTDKTVPRALLESETRDYIDAGLLLNSPYFSVLREERDIDLIVSLDFSDGDPFMTVREAAETCKKLKIPFPELNIPSEDVKKPNDFYVFKGKNAPTVIHIPLFNVVNCGDDIDTWRYKYGTFSFSYSAEMITKLMEVAGKNISNNREKLLKQIHAAIGQKHNKQHCV